MGGTDQIDPTRDESSDEVRSPVGDAAAPDRVMPPKVVLAFCVAMLAFHWIAPLSPWVPGPARWLGVVLMVLGVAIVVHVARTFAARKTTIKPFQESDALVAEGLFRWSRNPIYAAMTVFLVGFALALGTLGPALLLPFFPWWIGTRFIVHEEAMLEERFGDDYRAYRERVRRWL